MATMQHLEEQGYMYTGYTREDTLNCHCMSIQYNMSNGTVI